jgi:hypothetical protein
VRTSAIALLFIFGPSIGCISETEKRADQPNQGSPSFVFVRAQDLIPYIEAQQRAHVRTSTGIYAYQCFTDEDLRRFETNSLHLKIARDSRRTPQLRAIVVQLMAVSQTERRAILTEGRGIGHPTWAQLGRITTDGSGQTDAGYAAERLIARAIVNVAEQMISGSDR